MLKKILFSILFIVCFYAQSQDIRINEVVSSNSSFQDEDSDTPDWIEIHNFGNTPQSLANWTISDDIDNLLKWTFPEITLQPDEYIVLFASNKNIIPSNLSNLNNGSFLHTNFKISSNSEQLILSDNNSNIITDILIEGLITDSSYGWSENDNSYKIMLETTPGFVNTTTTYSGIINSLVQFSQEGGLKAGPILLNLSGNQNDETIRYTTDASIPTEASLEYTTPLNISDTEVIRARIFKNDFVPSATESKVYIFNADHNLPIVSLVTDPENLFNEDTGIYAFGDDYNSSPPFFGANFWEDWERPVNFAFYESNGDLGISLNAGIKIFGGWSRGNAQRSFSIFARSLYGTKEIEYPLFPNVPYDTFEAIVLRNSGNDWLQSNIKDISLTPLMEGADIEYQDYRPTVTYINGEYWGIYNMREKVNEHFLASKKTIDANEVTILEKQHETIEGNNQGYIDLLNYIENNDVTNTTSYNYIASQIDIDNFILYQLTQIFISNTDWPANNIKYWKTEKGKWRWIYFDTDHGFGFPDFVADGNPNFDNIRYAIGEDRVPWRNPEWSTFLLRELVNNEKFKNKFINRFADELNTRFLPENIKTKIQENQNIIASEINDHYLRWSGNPSNATHTANIMKSYADDRPFFVKNHIKSHFRLPDYHEITINNPEPTKGFVRINNNLKIQESNWNGDYFETVPITLKAIAETGYEFSHWSGNISSDEATIVVDVDNALGITANFKNSTTEIQNIVITEIHHKSSDLNDSGDWIEIYNPNPSIIDISNWILKNEDIDSEFTFPENTTIDPDGHLIVVRDLSRFSNVHPTASNVVGNFDFGFDGNDHVQIFNSDEELQDSVDYDNEFPWPVCNELYGRTIYLTDVSLDNNNAENWECSEFLGTPASIDEASEIVTNNHITIYPNPTSDYINITGENIKKINIFDITGQLVINESNNYSKISLNQLSSGMYFVKIRLTNNEIVNYKVYKN